jgi:hypothetical protein
VVVAARPYRGRGYSVRGVYQLLTSQESFHVESEADLIWHNQVPLKVSIFAWRLLQDKLPTKSNLVSRGKNTLDISFCTTDCGHVETTQHLFLSCSTFDSLWQTCSFGFFFFFWVGSTNYF